MNSTASETRTQDTAMRSLPRQRESVREMYQRQIREVRERPQERDTGRGR